MTPDDAIFKALADPTRRMLFATLCREGELAVTELTKGARISQPAVSKHLGVLRDAGLVAGKQDGRKTYYHARPEQLEAVAEWTAEMRRFWAKRLDKFEDLLNRMDQ